MLCFEVMTSASTPASSIRASSRPVSKGMGAGAAVAPVAGLVAMAGVAVASIVFLPNSLRRFLLQAILNFLQAGVRAGVVQLGARSAGGADRPDDFVAELDDHAAAEKHHMRQLRERHQRILLGAF